MIDKALDRLARIIELVLAFAFIVAVVLNFTNVVGRYLLVSRCWDPTRCGFSSWLL
jgi:TRAP-type C4-dicarboxylate transport system permease small subunit